MSRNDDNHNPSPPRRPDDPDHGATPETDQPPSFGSFVSSSVRRSAGRFRGGQANAPERPARASRERRASDESPSRTQRNRQFVPSGRRSNPSPDPEAIPPTNPAPNRAEEWFQELADRAGSPQRAIGAIAGLVVLVIVLIALLISLLGDEQENEPPAPTATSTPEESVLVPPGFRTPGVATPSGTFTPTPTTGEGPSRGALVTPTSGSDNQLEQPGQGTPAADASANIATARCAKTCLVRVENAGDAEKILAANGTRPSYTGNSWLWAIADPAAVAGISSALDTEVIRQSSETLSLYMVTVPQGVAEQGAVENFGTVLDSVDNYRLVQAERVPANVRVVLETGLIVEKVAPPPPASFARAADRPTLDEPTIGSLASKVDADNIDTTIRTFQAASSTDGTGVGTRYYTTPGNQLAADALYQELESFGLDVWYEDFVTPEGLLLVNVIGEIPGRDPSRIYGVMAHFDTISDTPTTVAPGADDNATGIASTLEISRILAGYDLKYSFRAVFTNAEEVGILGSPAFASDAVEAGDPWEGIFNIDSVGSSRHGNQIVLNATGDSVWMEDLLVRVNDAYGLGQTLNVQQSPAIVADDNKLRDQGIEAVMLARELYGWSPVHHTSKDLYEQVSIPHVVTAAQLVLLACASLLI